MAKIDPSRVGGSAGIGKATALAFSENGAIVTITGRRQERLDAVTKQMKQVCFISSLKGVVACFG